MRNVLEIKNLKYKDILKEISFSLEENSFYLLLGPNGSGKTTIVNCIRGILDYEGIVTIFNNNIRSNNHLIYRDIGFCLDEKIYLEGNVLDELLNILLNLDYEEENAKKQIFSITKKLGVSHILFKTQIDLLPHEEKILSFIISIIHNPKIIIIDNVFEILDNKFKKKIFEYLTNQKNKTILFITSDSDYYYLADKYLILRDGKIIELNSVYEVLENEKKLIKNGINMPFCLDLSNKLISYEILDKPELDMEEMVNKIWD